MLLENAVEGPETQELGRLERCEEALNRLNMHKVDSVSPACQGMDTSAGLGSTRGLASH